MMVYSLMVLLNDGGLYVLVQLWRSHSQRIERSPSMPDEIYILNIYWHHRISNEHVLQKTRQDSMEENLEQRRWNYFYPCQRIAESIQTVILG